MKIILTYLAEIQFISRRLLEISFFLVADSSAINDGLCVNIALGYWKLQLSIHRLGEINKEWKEND